MNTATFHGCTQAVVPKTGRVGEAARPCDKPIAVGRLCLGHFRAAQRRAAQEEADALPPSPQLLAEYARQAQLLASVVGVLARYPAEVVLEAESIPHIAAGRLRDVRQRLAKANTLLMAAEVELRHAETHRDRVLRRQARARKARQ